MTWVHLTTDHLATDDSLDLPNFDQFTNRFIVHDSSFVLALRVNTINVRSDRVRAMNE